MNKKNNLKNPETENADLDKTAAVNEAQAVESAQTENADIQAETNLPPDPDAILEVRHLKSTLRSKRRSWARR